jgi:hypothetical protein
MSPRSKPVRWIAVAVLTVLAGLLMIAPAFAQNGQGDDVTLDTDSEDDVYLAGNHVTVNANINGDLLVVARTLTLNGTVNGDLLFAGQSLIVNGSVEDDARIAGMILLFKDGSQVGDDINAAGYSVEMEPGSKADGKAYVAGYMVSLTDIGQDVGAAAGRIRLLGSIGGDVEISVGDSSDDFGPMTFTQDQDLPSYTQIPVGLTFGDDAAIKGNFDYTSPKEYEVPSGAVSGKVTFTKEVDTTPSSPRQPPSVDISRRLYRSPGFFVVNFVLLFGLGLVFQRFAPGFVAGSLNAMRKQVGQSIGFGLLGYLFFIGSLIALAFLTVLLIIPLGILGGAGPFLGLMFLVGSTLTVGFGALTGWIAPLLIAILIGEVLYGQINKQGASAVWSLVIGLLLVCVMLAVPVGSILIAFAIGVFGLGAVIVYWMGRGKSNMAPAPAVATAEMPAEPVPAEQGKSVRTRTTKKPGK